MNFEFIDLSLDDRQFKGETHNKNLGDAMKQAIVNFCKSMDTGLFLLDMPTGFGKTYSVLDFMVDNYDAPEFKDKKIFFVTTLKKNLPDKELREHFARRGKADDYDKYCFVPNEFILTPPMFNNIYKGALGEVVGKYILEQYAGVTLQEMPPEFFELFDYTLGNGVYVDFKLWKETMLISVEEEKKNVLEKLDKCGGKRTVIINIMLDHNMQITSSDSGRIIEIPYLYRLDRKEIGTEIIAKINREGYLQ